MREGDFIIGLAGFEPARGRRRGFGLEPLNGPPPRSPDFIVHMQAGSAGAGARAAIGLAERFGCWVLTRPQPGEVAEALAILDGHPLLRHPERPQVGPLDGRSAEFCRVSCDDPDPDAPPFTKAVVAESRPSPRDGLWIFAGKALPAGALPDVWIRETRVPASIALFPAAKFFLLRAAGRRPPDSGCGGAVPPNRGRPPAA